MRTYEAFTEESHSAVLALVARRWANLACRCVGADCEVNSSFPRMHYRSPSERQRFISKANSERRALSRAILSMTGREVPELPTAEFIKVYGDEYGGRYRGKTGYDRHKAIKIAEQLAGEILRW